MVSGSTAAVLTLWVGHYDSLMAAKFHREVARRIVLWLGHRSTRSCTNGLSIRKVQNHCLSKEGREPVRSQLTTTHLEAGCSHGRRLCERGQRQEGCLREGQRRGRSTCRRRISPLRGLIPSPVTEMLTGRGDTETGKVLCSRGVLSSPAALLPGEGSAAGPPACPAG